MGLKFVRKTDNHVVDMGEAAAGCGKEHVNSLTERVFARP
jgi:hypothetical protein